MLSSLNAFGGLSSTEISMLFGSNSPSSSSNATPSNTTQSAQTGVDASGANNSANVIQAILAQADMATSTGGWASIASAQTAYTAEIGDSSFAVSASVAIASPNAAQQIADALSVVQNTIVTQSYVDPATHNGASAYTAYVSVSAADAVNITMSDGAISATAIAGANFPNGLPSLASIQQALSGLKTQDQSIGWDGVAAGAWNPEITEAANPTSMAKDVADAWWNSVSGSFTLVQLPSNASGADGGNIATFSANGTNWAIVLPQDEVSVTLSETQTMG